MRDLTIACVQMDCRKADVEGNREAVLQRLEAAVETGARLVVFPECALTGYAFDSKEEALAVAEAIPGQSTESLVTACRKFGVWTVVGTLARSPQGDEVHNVAMLIGPQGLAGVYCKAHLPYLGVDRFTAPGNEPFRVFDVEGYRLGMLICYDGSFPEATRCLALAGADIVVLPTNWPMGAMKTAQYIPAARAIENHIYFVACNRVGEEGGFRFVGMSQIRDVDGDPLAIAGEDEEIISATIDPSRARDKHLIFAAGAYEIDRIAQRRPDLYGPLVEPLRQPFRPKGSQRIE